MRASEVSIDQVVVDHDGDIWVHNGSGWCLVVSSEGPGLLSLIADPSLPEQLPEQFEPYLWLRWLPVDRLLALLDAPRSPTGSSARPGRFLNLDLSP